MIFQPIDNEGYKLFHEGVLTLSQIEANGICVDLDYLQHAHEESKTTIKRLKQELTTSDVYKLWRRRYGAKTNLGSRQQLGTILFDVLKLPCEIMTPSGRYSTDDKLLRGLKHPFVDIYLQLGKQSKAFGTYLKGIEREVCGNLLHPVFNLHIPATFRSSSDSPNFQNQPRRNAEIAKLVRTAFIPRAANRQLVEIDFKGAEVSNAACYTKDPKLVKYVADPKTDMHRDMAEECYLLTRRDLTAQNDSKEERLRAKAPRDITKNKFTFPEFYGNWYKAVAKDLWEGMEEMDMHTADGVSLKKHLRRQGIRGMGDCDPEKDPIKGTFEYHIQQVEKAFWGKRFKVYARWKQEWYDDYLERGFFDTLTGFRCQDIMDRKQCVNYPIQGSAFHCLLWCLIRVQKLLKKYHLRSLLIGQIHDSMLLDVLTRELKTVLEIIRQVTMVDLAKHWKWIIVPMIVEAEASPPGKSWYDKKEIPL